MRHAPCSRIRGCHQSSYSTTPGPLPTLSTDLDHGQTHNWMLSSTHTLPRHPQIPQTLTPFCLAPPQHRNPPLFPHWGPKHRTLPLLCALIAAASSAERDRLRTRRVRRESDFGLCTRAGLLGIAGARGRAVSLDARVEGAAQARHRVLVLERPAFLPIARAQAPPLLPVPDAPHLLIDLQVDRVPIAATSRGSQMQRGKGKGASPLVGRPARGSLPYYSVLPCESGCVVTPAASRERVP